MGKTAAATNIPADPTSEIAVTDVSGELIAIARLADGPEGQVLKPSKVFVQPLR